MFETPPPLLEIKNLSIDALSAHGRRSIVSHVSLSLHRAKSLAIVGESGSGKSVTALSITHLLPSPPLVYREGHIFFDGVDLISLSQANLRKYRGGRIAYVFQDVFRSLNPVYSIRRQMAESLKLHRPDIHDHDHEILRWLEIVGITRPKERLYCYPHELSGGMQQRVMIAMALCTKPDLLIADEPTTALDVTIQAQILAKLRELQQELGMALLFITHNFSIIRGLAHHVAVMYQGRIVEYGETEEILSRPKHPYTQALIACIPRLDDSLTRLPIIGSDAFVR
jgi:ABC-type dipeptide/oligopeptide/nickel transport system ATPase component